LEQIALTLLTTALEKALDVGHRYLREAENQSQYNVRACIAYLEAARAAIRGLEEELDEILIETETVVSFPQEWEKRPDIFERINSYLNRDRLRPILDSSLVGIDHCQKVAEEDAASFFQWPSQRDRRTQTVDHLSSLFKNLHNYLTQLSDQIKPNQVNFAGPSGLYRRELRQLKELLDDSRAGAKDPATRKEEIKTLVNRTQEGRTRLGLPLAAQAEGVSRDLTVAFRLAAVSDPAQESA